MSRVAATGLAIAAVVVAASPPDAVARSTTACRATTVSGSTDPTLDTASLGRKAPAGYEIGLPRSRRTERIMMLIHGGGWTKVGQGALNTERAAARAWRHAGWTTVNLDYRACRDSSADILKFYDLIRRRFGSGVPICAQGESAGGHLALNLAVRRPDISCVIAYAAPTDLAHGTSTVRAIARTVFGAKRLTRMSPVARAGAIHARLLLATAQDDAVVPASQASKLQHAVASDVYTDVVRLPPGRLTFVHGTTSPAGLLDLQRHVAALVQPFGSAPGAFVAPPFLPFPRRV